MVPRAPAHGAQPPVRTAAAPAKTAAAPAKVAAAPAKTPAAPAPKLTVTATPFAGGVLRTVVIEKGSTLLSALIAAGVNNDAANDAIRALAKQLDPNKVAPGQKIEVLFAGAQMRVSSVRLPISASKGVQAVAAAGNFTASTYDPSHVPAPATGPLVWVDGGVTSRTLELKAGQTLMAAVLSLGADRLEADRAAAAVGKLFNVRKMQLGQHITAIFGDGMQLLGLSVSLDGDAEVAAYLSEAGVYEPTRTTADERAELAATVGQRAPVQDLPDVAATPLPLPVAIKTGAVGKGDTLIDVMLRLGAGRAEAAAASQAVGTVLNLRQLQIGQSVAASFGQRDGDRAQRLIAVSVATGPDKEVAAIIAAGDEFTALRTTPAQRIQRLAAIVTPAAPAPVAAAPTAVADAGTAAANAPLQPLDLATTFHTAIAGETIVRAAITLGASLNDALLAAQALAEEFPTGQLAQGQLVTATLGRVAAGGETRLLALSIVMAANDEILALLTEDGAFETDHMTPAERAKLIAESLAPRPQAEDVVAEADTGDDVPGLVGYDHNIQTLIVSRGDTLLSAAINLGAARADAVGAIEALTTLFDARSLRVGQVIEATFGRIERDGPMRLLVLALAVNSNVEVAAFLSETGNFAPRTLTKEEHEQIVAAVTGEGVPDVVAAPATATPAVIAAAPSPTPGFEWLATIDRSVTVKPGSTLLEAVLSAGATQQDAHDAIEALTEIFNPRALQAGQVIRLSFGGADQGDWSKRLVAVNLPLNVEREVAALRAPTGDFGSKEIVKPLGLDVVRASGTIGDSLFGAAAKAGVPSTVIMDLVKIFSWDVDFQRDIQTGDKFDVMFQRYVDDHGNPVKVGAIQYASLTLSGTTFKLYRHETADGVIDYYNEQGASARKALLRTPIDGARLTSTFSNSRMHPVLGYSRAHKGVDFGAPMGTPIQAAGDGIIEFAGPFSGYGNYVRIRHNSDYKTAYGHMTAFAKGIRPGVKVRQGQIIGYVGMTGLATGPHLHYEILVHDTQVSPLAVKMAIGKKLEDRELAQFQGVRQKTDVALATVPALRLAAK